MKNSKLKLFSITTAILVLLILILLILAVSQQIASSRLSSRISRQKEQLVLFTDNAASNKTIAGNYTRLSYKLGGESNDISWDAQMPRMINALTGVANKYNINIESLKPEPIAVSGNINRFPLRISFKAKIKQMAEILRDIENVSPSMDIEELNIRLPDNKDGVLQADLIVSAFVIKKDKSANALLDSGKIASISKTENEMPEKTDIVSGSDTELGGAL